MLCCMNGILLIIVLMINGIGLDWCVDGFVEVGLDWVNIFLDIVDCEWFVIIF